jgi:hypothetical protein
MTTATTLSQPTTPAAKAIMSLYQIGLGAGAGALAGLAFGIINPIGGAIFGAATITANWIGRSVTDSLPIEDAGAKTALDVAAFILSIGLGIMAVTYAGFTLTAMGAIGMVFAMMLTEPVAKCTANCFANRSNGML